MLAALPEHDNVVKVLDAGLWDQERVFIASELCSGGSLDAIAASGPVDPARACDLLSQACRGLAHLHFHDLLHLDLRPANILIANGAPRLVDFGLARWADKAEVEEWYSPHAAPELIETGYATPSTDIYAMAMTLAHLVTEGRICRPFPTGGDLVQASADGDWPRLEDLGSNIPARLRKLIEASTSYAASERPQTVDDFKRLLDKATPAVSFFASDPSGTLVSSDGSWSISVTRDAGNHSVEVRRGGRRRKPLGLLEVTPVKAQKHVSKLVRQFADGTI